MGGGHEFRTMDHRSIPRHGVVLGRSMGLRCSVDVQTMTRKKVSNQECTKSNYRQRIDEMSKNREAGWNEAVDAIATMLWKNGVACEHIADVKSLKRKDNERRCTF